MLYCEHLMLLLLMLMLMLMMTMMMMMLMLMMNIANTCCEKAAATAAPLAASTIT